MTNATKTVHGITYNAQFHVRNGKYVGVTYTHDTDKGVRAVAWNATRILATLNTAFATESASFKAAL